MIKKFAFTNSRTIEKQIDASGTVEEEERQPAPGRGGGESERPPQSSGEAVLPACPTCVQDPRRTLNTCLGLTP